MDTIVPRKNRKKTYLLILLPVFLLAGYFTFTSLTKKRNLNVNRSEIVINKVENNYFEDFITFQAKAEPINSILLNVTEGGSIKEIFIANGDFVQKGQPLARLYNPNSELNYVTQETSIIEQINNLDKARLDLRNQELGLAKDLIDIEHDYLDAKALYELNKKLFGQEILSANEWEKTQENFRFQKERKNIIQQSVQKEKEANKLQLSQIAQAQSAMRKSLGILRDNKNNFLVTAPVSGRVSSFEPILGKNYAAGESIGKIDVMQGYKLVADIDEFYLEKIIPGQKGTIEFQDKIITVVISKVIPEIKTGRFQVELSFGEKSPELQQGVSFSVRLQFSEKSRTLLIPKGAFYQETAGNWIFVVDGNKAERRRIKTGRENPLYYEILSGLKPDENVVTSGYNDFKDIQNLTINN